MGDHHHGPAKGLSRWLFTTNHKDIGTMYLWFSFSMFILGGTFAMIIRAELFQPGLQLVDPEFFNQMTTLHGLVMVFGAIMPSFVGLANWMIPLMIGDVTTFSMIPLIDEYDVYELRDESSSETFFIAHAKGSEQLPDQLITIGGVIKEMSSEDDKPVGKFLEAVYFMDTFK